MEKIVEKKEGNVQPNKVWEQGSLAFQLGFSIIVPIVGGLFLGRFLDTKFSTHPLLMITLLISGIAISFFVAKDTVAKIIQSK